MSNINFFYYNLVEQTATTITATSVNAQYPLSNIKKPFSTMVFRSTAASDSVVFDFKDINEVDSILVRSTFATGWGHGNLTIEANATDEWTSPSYSTTLVVDPDWDIAYKILSSAESYRFWRITGTGSSYFELSNIYIGKRFVPARNFDFNWKVSSIDLSRSTENEYGQVFIDERSDIKEYSFEINLFDKDLLDSFNEFFGYCGKKIPFWLIVDIDEVFTNDSELFAGQFYFKSRPDIINTNFGIFKTSAGIRECI